jgi:hypothetical protein
VTWIRPHAQSPTDESGHLSADRKTGALRTLGRCRRQPRVGRPRLPLGRGHRPGPWSLSDHRWFGAALHCRAVERDPAGSEGSSEEPALPIGVHLAGDMSAEVRTIKAREEALARIFLGDDERPDRPRTRLAAEGPAGTSKIAKPEARWPLLCPASPRPWRRRIALLGPALLGVLAISRSEIQQWHECHMTCCCGASELLWQGEKWSPRVQAAANGRDAMSLGKPPRGLGVCSAGEL